MTPATVPTPSPDSPESPLAEADPALIARMTRGDRGALSELYGRHAPTLLALAIRMMRNRQDSEDLIHDVFLEAWQHCTEYVETRGSVRGWLLLRTRSRALDRLRTRARRLREATSDHAAAPADAATRLDPASSDKYRLPAALARIPETQQDVIVLSYFEGLSTLEISSRLGIPTGTVKSRTHAAIASLRGALGVSDE